MIAEIVRTDPCDVWAGREGQERETIRLISDLLWPASPALVRDNSEMVAK